MTQPRLRLVRGAGERPALPSVVYVAGKFRGPNSWAVEANVREAESLALAVWACGYAAICPHTNTRFYQGALPDHVWLTGDLAILRGCDALLTVPNWTDSAGAREEVEFAEANGIPVFHDLNTLTKVLPQTS